MTRITRTIKTYSLTASGRNFKSRPDSIEVDEISEQVYNNISNREALHFWNGFFGGTCRAEYGHTCKGYCPIRITRKNPDRSKKIVETFQFDYIER